MNSVNTTMNMFQGGRPDRIEKSGGGPPPEIQQMIEQKRNATSSPNGTKLSSMGEMLSNMDHSQIQSFRTEVMEGIQSGEFNSASMAEAAPDALKTFAEENGIDLEEHLQKISSRLAQRFNSGEGGPAQGLGNIQSAYQQEDDSISTLLESLLDNSKS